MQGDIINNSYFKKSLVLFLSFILLSLTYCGKGAGFKSPGNNPPAAYDTSVTTLINSSVDIILQASDPENQVMTFRIVDQPAHGSLVQETYNIFRYTPEADYEGNDDFTFRVNDGVKDSNTGEVSILIGIPNHPPVAHDADIYTAFNTGCEVILSATDADNDEMEIYIVQQPEYGTLTKTGDNYYYQPAENFYGFITILFRARDAYSTSNIGTITIEVGITNNPPVAVVITETINEDSQYILPFSITMESYEIWDQPVTYIVPVQPEHGAVVYNSLTDEWIFTPETNYHGVVAFYYRAFDGLDYSTDTLVTLNITSQNDAPAVADFTLIITDSFTSYNIPIQGSDPDGDELTFTINNNPSLPGSFSYTQGDENAVYTSPGVAGNYGLYELTYTARDTENVVSNTGTIYIVIRPENVWFVNPANTGIQTGRCWHQGFRYISDAVAAAKAGDQIWITGGAGVIHKVKPGEYTAADFTGKTDAINNTGLSLTGGFSTDSYNVTDSDPELFPSVIDGEYNAEHVIKAENYCVIKNITVTGGNARGTEAFNCGGGIYIPDSKTNVSVNGVIFNSSMAVSGGGIYVGNNCSEVTIEQSQFTGNTSENRGAGAAVAENTAVTLTYCQFLLNVTQDFGGGLSDMGTVTAENCLFSNNEAQYGAGLYDHNSLSVYTNCRFESNRATKSGGGIFNHGSITLTDCEIIENSALTGGGVFNDASGIADPVNAAIAGCIISGNTVTQNGAGMYNLHSKLLIDSCEITLNSNTGTEDGNDGAGIYCTENTDMTVNNTDISNNTANKNGGGIFSTGYNTLTLDGVTIDSNKSGTGDGGGIYLSQTTAYLSDSQVINNTAVNGGGIYIENHSRLYFTGSAAVFPYIKLNTASRYGGGLYSENYSLFEITNAYIYNNQFTLDSGSGAGIYADTSYIAINSVYVEKNHGPGNTTTPQNYSGYYLKNCNVATLVLFYTGSNPHYAPPSPEELNNYNLLYGNFLYNNGEPDYNFQFYNDI